MNRIKLLITLICFLKANVNGQSLCASNPCPVPNDYLCIDRGFDYQCICVSPNCLPTTTIPPTTTTLPGVTTLAPTDFCASNPCSAGYLCVSYTTTYSCLCISSSCTLSFTTTAAPTTTTSAPTTTTVKRTTTTVAPTTTTTTVSSTTASTTKVAPTTTTIKPTTTSVAATTAAPVTTTPILVTLYNLCSPNPCQNNGKCVQTSQTSAICQCTPNFTGFICEKPNVCVSNPCLNGGECQVIFGATTFYRCRCSKGYTGVNCQTPQNPCSTTVCLNGGTCTVNAQTQTASCICSIFYTGSRCERDFNPCLSASGQNICQNFGRCQINYGVSPYFQCTCKLGYSGSTCEIAPVTTTRSPSENSCEDKDPNTCAYYALNNYCSKLYYIYQIPIPTYCPKSCKTCKNEDNGSLTKPCKDTQSVCAFWAASGLCSALTDTTICPKSCGTC